MCCHAELGSTPFVDLPLLMRGSGLHEMVLLYVAVSHTRRLARFRIQVPGPFHILCNPRL